MKMQLSTLPKGTLRFAYLERNARDQSKTFVFTQKMVTTMVTSFIELSKALWHKRGTPLVKYLWSFLFLIRISGVQCKNNF